MNDVTDRETSLVHTIRWLTGRVTGVRTEHVPDDAIEAMIRQAAWEGVHGRHEENAESGERRGGEVRVQMPNPR
jgi:hypothetical protein